MNMRLIFSLLALAVLIIGFPAVSWYYLNSGYEYRSQLLEDLKDHGQMDPEKLAEITGVSAEIFDESVVLVNYALKEEADKKSEHFDLLMEQFGERQDLKLLVLAETELTGELKGKLEKARLNETRFLQVSYLSKEEILSIAKDQLLVEDANPALIYTLIDGDQKVRRHYEIGDPNQLRNMIEHMAMLIVPISKRDSAAKLIRAKEK